MPRAWDHSMEYFHVLPVSAWDLFGDSVFLPQSKNTRVRRIGNSTPSLGVTVNDGLSSCVTLQ